MISLIQDDIGSFDVEEAETRSCSSKLKIAGKMHIVAFLTPRATVGEALAAMRKDIVNSISGRFQMHCQSLQGDEAIGLDPSGVPTLHEPPRRIMLKLPHSYVHISDYLFPGKAAHGKSRKFSYCKLNDVPSFSRGNTIRFKRLRAGVVRLQGRHRLRG